MKNEKISRREFFKDFGLALGSTAVLASFPWLSALSDENKKATRGDKARIGVIGPGSRGQYLLNLLVMNPKAEIVWLCDDYQPSLDAALQIAPGAKTTTDYRVVLDDSSVDAVVIATPLSTHAKIVLDALQAGKHVYCEKSMSNKLDEARAMYDAYKASDRVFFIGQQRLYDPVYIKAIEMVESGMFGNIEGIKTFWYRNNDWRRPVPSPELERKINWRMYREYSCGVMTELACHQIQMGTWIWKDIPETIYGVGAITHWQDGREVEDNVGVVYAYKDGRRMTFDSIISNKFYGLEEQILGNKGTLEPEKAKFYYEQTPPMPGFLNMLNDIEAKVFDKLNFASPSWDPEVAKENKGEYIIGKKRDFPDGTIFIVDAFVEAVITGQQPPKVAEEGYYATVLSLLGQKSMDEKTVLTFPEEYKIDYL